MVRKNSQEPENPVTETPDETRVTDDTTVPDQEPESTETPALPVVDQDPEPENEEQDPEQDTPAPFVSTLDQEQEPDKVSEPPIYEYTLYHINKAPLRGKPFTQIMQGGKVAVRWTWCD